MIYMSPEFLCMQALVRSVLEHRESFHWSVQGFGMLRTYPDKAKQWRLNVWDDRLAVKGVSTIHDHPWHFQSWIIAGDFLNTRYSYQQIADEQTLPFMRWRIQTGEGGGPREDAHPVLLQRRSQERYEAGQTYKQHADEVHESSYANGTVTINDRRRLPDGEHAYVFWPQGQKWVDAEPRDATAAERDLVLDAALERWFPHD